MDCWRCGTLSRSAQGARIVAPQKRGRARHGVLGMADELAKTLSDLFKALGGPGAGRAVTARDWRRAGYPEPPVGSYAQYKRQRPKKEWIYGPPRSDEWEEHKGIRERHVTPKSDRARCGARCRDGHTCQAPPVWDSELDRPRNGRCRNHGGLSTGPRTKEGRERLAECARRRARAQHMATRLGKGSVPDKDGA